MAAPQKIKQQDPAIHVLHPPKEPKAESLPDHGPVLTAALFKVKQAECPSVDDEGSPKCVRQWMDG